VVVLRNVGLNVLGALLSVVAYGVLLCRWRVKARSGGGGGRKQAVVLGQGGRRKQQRKKHTSAETVVLTAALGKLRAKVSVVAYTEGRGDSGLFFLLLFTQAAITTVVGVCMLMKHDGMDAEGVLRWAFEGRAFPWRLQPLWR
jgi:hypothetical protein